MPPRGMYGLSRGRGNRGARPVSFKMDKEDMKRDWPRFRKAANAEVKCAGTPAQNPDQNVVTAGATGDMWTASATGRQWHADVDSLIWRVGVCPSSLGHVC